MARKKSSRRSRRQKPLFGRIAEKITKATGSPAASITAILIVIIWATSGPLFDYSERWQLVINTGTTIITFLMVFFIQQSQNKDTTAIQLKLNELIACNEKASNRLIDIEDLSEAELDTIKKFYQKLSMLADKETDLSVTHSYSEADENHIEKKSMRRTRKTKKI